MKNKSMITAIKVSDESIWDGAKVRLRGTTHDRTIKMIPENMRISEAVTAGIFNPHTDLDYNTFMLNKHRYELSPEETEPTE